MNDTLHSKILGKGKPLLILHGFLGMSDNWKTLGGQYAESGFEVHLIDQRNHGRSFWSDDFNYDLLADDLKSYITQHQLVKALILGHSMGGKTAMKFACKNPQLTERLLIADIAPKYYPPHHQPIIDGLNTLDFDKLSSRNEANAQLERHIEDVGTRQFLLKNLYWIEKEKLGLRFNLAVLGQKMDEIGEHIGVTDSYEGPTLFLRGERSEYIAQSDLQEIKRYFPMAALDTISNAGHWLQAQNPKEFFSKSMAFFKIR